MEAPEMNDRERLEALIRTADSCPIDERFDEVMPIAETLAGMADGAIRLEDLDDAHLQKCLDTVGPSIVAAALAESVTRSTSSSSEWSFIRLLNWINAYRSLLIDTFRMPMVRVPASVLGAALVGFVVWRMFPVRQQPTIPIASTTHRERPLASPQDHSGKRPLENAQARPRQAQVHLPRFQQLIAPPTALRSTPLFELARQLPDFNPDRSLTMGAPSTNRLEPTLKKMRHATIIVQTEHGWANGVLVGASSSHWALTTYSAVAVAAQEESVRHRNKPITAMAYRAMEDGTPSAKLHAALYYVDPSRDLALLKVTSPVGYQTQWSSRAGLSRAVTASAIGSECNLVGSQEGKGGGWQIRGCEITGLYSLPQSNETTAQAHRKTPYDAARLRGDFFETDADVSKDDIGSPLFDGDGNLIGLTVSVARSDTGSPMHRSSNDIAPLIARPPVKPQNIPFDPWTAGLPDAERLAPQLLDEDHDACSETLLHRLRAERAGATVVAETRFIALTKGCQEPSVVPRGLWGMEGNGGFAFDAFVTVRTDGVVAMGYTNKAGVVDEIRIGSLNGESRLIWTRTADGQWSDRTAKRSSVLNTTRLGLQATGALQRLIQPMLDTEETKR